MLHHQISDMLHHHQISDMLHNLPEQTKSNINNDVKIKSIFFRRIYSNM
jgi:hypothetical protein